MRLLFLVALTTIGCATVSGAAAYEGKPVPEIPEWIGERSFGAREGGELKLYGVARIQRSGNWRNYDLLRTTGMNRARAEVMELLGMGQTLTYEAGTQHRSTTRVNGRESTSEHRSRESVRLRTAHGMLGPARLAAAWYDRGSEDLYLLLEVIPFQQDLALPPEPPIDLRSNQLVDEAFSRFGAGSRHHLPPVSTEGTRVSARPTAGQTQKLANGEKIVNGRLVLIQPDADEDD